mmetsp:Transcript_20082/g.17198  ORF Transcript_20082/g.17198 Transcript_20082/m.17198 type:complete len:130 (-) Transcript_20082:583-972(-)
MLGARSISSQIGEIDVGLLGRREFDLSLFGSFSESLNDHLVLGDVHTRLVLEFLQKIVLEDTINIFTTAGSITVSGLDFENTLGNFEDGNIKGTTSQIVDSNDFAVILVETVGQRGSSGLVNNSKNVHA